MTRFWWLGVDHAESGAATLLSPSCKLTVLWAWRPRQRNGMKVYDVAICQGSNGRMERVDTMDDIGHLIAGGCQRVTGKRIWGVGSEAVYVGRNARTALKTATNAGKIVGPLVRHAPGRKVHWIEAKKWRKTVFPPGWKKLVEPVGMSKNEKPGLRHYAKAASLKFVPPRLPPLALQLQRAAPLLEVPWNKLDHGTDAGGIGEHCWLHEKELIGG